MSTHEYWINQLTEHLTTTNLDLYQSYLGAGEWETFCNSVAQEAQATYEQLLQHYRETGSNQATAEMLAQSEVMRSQILSIGVDHEMMEEEPDEEMDADYLSFLQEE